MLGKVLSNVLAGVLQLGIEQLTETKDGFLDAQSVIK